MSSRPKIDPSALDADARALNEAVSDLVRIYQFRDRDQICCYDISVTQCYALEALEAHGAMRSGALAALLRIDKSTTTRVVDALVRKEYVARMIDAEDRRAVALQVTAAGRRLLRKIQDGLVAQHLDLLSDLTPEVRSQTIAVLRQLARRAEARFAAGVSVGCADACDTGSCG
jgi:DNA-binding MarR family transcriptional regulator